MIEDSLARYAPGTTLQSHACAAALRYKLGFADASATRYPRPGMPLRIVVAVREPQDSALVKYRAMPLDTAPARPDWRIVSELFSKRPASFWNLVQLHTAQPGQMGLRYGAGEDSVATSAALAFLRQRTSEQDRIEARDVLSRSPNIRDRAVAALILSNFADRDDTYWILIDAMRESDGQAKSVAGQVLEAASNRVPRSVNWKPAVGAIHAMLNGTSLFELPVLLRVLNRTGVGPADARAFLHGGGDMLLNYVASETQSLSRPSLELLARLRGSDLGPSPAAWRSWIETL
jgi:hypothetical protein